LLSCSKRARKAAGDAAPGCFQKRKADSYISASQVMTSVFLSQYDSARIRFLTTRIDDSLSLIGTRLELWLLP
jgi:hypothetical protein